MVIKLVEFDERDGGLAIRLNADGLEAIGDLDVENSSGEQLFRELIGYQLGNGWDLVESGDIGALTDGTILTRDCDRDDSGRITRLGRVYWHDRYQVEDPYRALLDGELWLRGVDN